jgi:hypothetical protein
MMMDPSEPEELEMTGTETKPDTAPPLTIPGKPLRKTHPDKIERPSKDPERKAEMDEEDYLSAQAPMRYQSQGIQRNQSQLEEEMSGSQIDMMIQEISDEFGVDTQGGALEIDGIKFEFQSEPMCFAVNGKTMKNLVTSTDVINFVNSGKHKVKMSAQAQRRSQAQAQGMPRAQTQTTTQTPSQAPSLSDVPGGGQRNPVAPGQPMQEKFRRKY